MREFELQKMKESEIFKEYSDIVWYCQMVKLLGTKFKDIRIVEKVFVTVLERYIRSV